MAECTTSEDVVMTDLDEEDYIGNSSSSQSTVTLPSEVWAMAINYLPYDSLISCAATSRSMLHDVLPLVTTLHIEKSSQLRVGIVSKQFRDVRSVSIYNLFDRREVVFGAVQVANVDEDIATNSVFFLSRFPYLESVTFWGRWGDGLCSLKSIHIIESQRSSIYHLLDSFSAAFDCNHIPQNLQIKGLSCPNKAPSNNCKSCKRICRKFPLERTLDVDLCLPYSSSKVIIEGRKGGRDYLHSETRLMQLLGKGVDEDASLIIEYSGRVKDELKTIVESSHGVDVTKLKQEDIRKAIMKQHSNNTVAYLSEESFDDLKTIGIMPISNDLLDPDAIRVENLDRMVKHVMEETTSLQNSIWQINNLLTSEDKTQDTKMVQLVVEAGVLSKLVELLSRDNDNNLQLAAVEVLTNVASGKSKHAEEFVKLGAVTPLVHLLGSSHSKIPPCAAWALSNIAGDVSDHRDLVLQSGVMQPLLKLLENHQTSDVKSVRIYVWTLCNICRGKPKPDFNLVSSSLHTLNELVHHSDEEVVTDACWTLSYLSDGPNTTHIQAIINAFDDTGVRRLVELLNHPSTSLQASALRTLGNIATGNISQIPCLLDLFENQSFSELKTLLGSLRSNRALYDQYYGKVITVPCKNR